VSLSFDDSRESQLRGVRILDEHGIRASFYVLPSGIGAAPDHWSSVVSAGHEIGNHTSSHPCSANYEFSRTNALEDKTMDELAADIDEAGQVIEDLLGVRPKSFAYPCGQSFVGRGSRRRSYVPLVAERFLAGRGYGSETGNMPGSCDLAHLDAYVIDGLDIDALLSLVGRGMAHGEWVIMAGHDIGSHGRQTVCSRALDGFCRRLARDDRIWVAPVVEVAGHVLAARATHRPG
jgi:peptidoglycan/xylan/chitin deacetylase (PgdA/CDA1 family)